MFLGSALNGDPVPGLVSPDIDSALLEPPDPEGEQSVDTRVDSYSDCGIDLCAFEPELVVPGEACSTNSESEIAEAETHVSEEVRLFEGYAV